MSSAVPPPLSVVVPTSDTRELTLACLGSLYRDEAAQPMEVILVDDASRDGTAGAAAARWPDLRVVAVGERSVGFTASANRGLELASGSVLLLLNSDTAAQRGALTALLAAFSASPRLGVAGTTLLYPDGRRQWSHGRVPGLLWLFALASGTGMLWGRVRQRLAPKSEAAEVPSGSAAAGRPRWQPVGWVTGAALAMRREVWEQVGPLDEGFEFYAQDLDYCLRARSAGWQVGTVPASRIVHHHGATIRATGGPTIASQQPRLLWTDLLRWARKHRGELWARRASWALRLGARLRLALRRSIAPLLPSGRRPRWAQGTAAFEEALARLTLAEDSR